jgi:hypothetical protein
MISMGLLNKVLKFFIKNPQMESATKEIQDSSPKAIKHRNLSVNIGIDFGTSYRKVCFAERKTFSFVNFEGSEYKPSLIYFIQESKSISYTKPENTARFEEIRYFKYSMIDDSLPKSKDLAGLNTKVKPEILCSLFFLACLIKESKESAFNFFHKKLGNINIEWFITLGVPIDNFANENRLLYDKLLNLANKLSDNITEFSITIKELETYFIKNKNISIPRFQTSNLNTLPELYAESLVFLQNRNVLRGAYALVDVGGGTVDLAMMFKEDNGIFSIVSKNVQPLGIEIISNNIVYKNDGIERARIDLKEKRTLAGLPYIYSEKEGVYKYKFKVAFATIVAELKSKDVRSNYYEEHVLNSHNRTIYIIVCGGGANYKWYEDGILQNQENLRPLLKEGLRLEIVPVNKLLPKSINNHRLLIAYSLSQPVEYIPPLHGFPWDFEEKKYGLTKEEKYDRYYALQEKTREIYGETL